MSKENGFVDMIDKLHKTIYNQDQRIAELEEQLQNATKQVRNEVCDKIRKWHDEECESLDLDSDFDVGYSGALSNLWGILDQLQEQSN